MIPNAPGSRPPGSRSRRLDRGRRHPPGGRVRAEPHRWAELDSPSSHHRAGAPGRLHGSHHAPSRLAARARAGCRTPWPRSDQLTATTARRPEALALRSLSAIDPVAVLAFIGVRPTFGRPGHRAWVLRDVCRRSRLGPRGCSSPARGSPRRGQHRRRVLRRRLPPVPRACPGRRPPGHPLSRYRRTRRRQTVTDEIETFARPHRDRCGELPRYAMSVIVARSARRARRSSPVIAGSSTRWGDTQRDERYRVRRDRREVMSTPAGRGPAVTHCPRPRPDALPAVDGQATRPVTATGPCATARLTSAEMLADIDKETVDSSQYDGTQQQPSVPPAKLPNLLVNGSSGSLPGWRRTSRPSPGRDRRCHDRVGRRPELTSDELCQFVLGPDFPTGGTAVPPDRRNGSPASRNGRRGPRMYAHGRGRCGPGPGRVEGRARQDGDHQALPG
jgi:hypothetical protein